MLAKAIFFVVLLMLSIVYDKNSNKNNIISKLLHFLILVFLAISFSMREFIFENVGTDYYSYKEWYDYTSFSSINWLSISNIGFNILISLSKLIFANYYFFLFIIGLIINYCILKFIERNSKNKYLSIIIYFTFFYFNTFNIMRQWVACSIFLVAYHCIEEKKLLKYIILCLIASSFHLSAILLLFLYPLLNIEKVTFKRFIIIVIAGLLVIVNLSYIEKNIIYSSDISLFSNYLRYANYKEGLSNYVYSLICLVNILMLMLTIKISDYNLKEKQNSIKFLYLLLALIFSYISIKSFAFARFSIYFLPSIMITIPDVIYLFRKKDKFIASMIICIILFYILIT